jgi:hypothetical protein
MGPHLVAGVVAYHELCWWLRDRRVGPIEDPGPFPAARGSASDRAQEAPR